MRLSAFARVCLRLLAFAPLRLLAFVRVCLRLLAFARICLRPPLLRPPLRDTDCSQLPKGIRPSEPCWESFKLCFCHSANRHPVRDYLQVTDRMSEGDVVAACKLLLTLSPSSGRDQLLTQVQIAQTFRRLNVATAFQFNRKGAVLVLVSVPDKRLWQFQIRLRFLENGSGFRFRFSSWATLLCLILKNHC